MKPPSTADTTTAEKRTFSSVLYDINKGKTPAAFTVRIAPFLGVPAADIRARLRWRIADGELTIGYALLRPDHVRRDIISTLIGELRGMVEAVPVFMGLPPAAVQVR